MKKLPAKNTAASLTPKIHNAENGHKIAVEKKDLSENKQKGKF